MLWYNDVGSIVVCYDNIYHVICEPDSKLHECQVEDYFTNVKIKKKQRTLFHAQSSTRLVIKMSDNWSNTSPKDKYFNHYGFSYENSNRKIHPKK